jgi:hypothetical protein
LAASIRQVEGYNPNFAANNNPGNLIYVGQAGAVPGAGGFAKFPTAAAGEAALESQIQNYIDRGYNLSTFFNTYAPGNTKNAAGGVQTPAATQAYINTVSSQLGIDPSIPLNSVQSSFTGPGSFTAPSATPDSSSSSDASGSDSSWASIFPDVSSSSDSPTYDLAGVVLTQNELIGVGAAIAATLLVFSIL